MLTTKTDANWSQLEFFVLDLLKINYRGQEKSFFNTR